MKRILVTLLAIAGAQAYAATVMPGITSITYTGTATVDTGGFGNNPTYLIDNSGLSAAATIVNYTTITHAQPTNTNMWTTNDRGGPTDFFSSGAPTVVFEVVLDGTYEITDFVSWGYQWNSDGSSLGNNFKTLTFDYGVGNYTGGTLSSIDIPQNAPDRLGDVTSLTPFTADRVRITVADNYYGGSYSGGDRASLAELRFLGNAVPETSVALLGAVGVLGVLRRRRL